MAAPLLDSMIAVLANHPLWATAGGHIRDAVFDVLHKQQESGEIDADEALALVLKQVYEDDSYHEFQAHLPLIVQNELSLRANKMPQHDFSEFITTSSYGLLQDVYLYRPLLRAQLHEILLNTPLTPSLRKLTWSTQMAAGVTLPVGMSVCEPLLNSTTVPVVPDAALRTVISWTGWNRYPEIHNTQCHKVVATIAIVTSNCVSQVPFQNAILLAIPLVLVFGPDLELKTFNMYMATVIDGITLCTEHAKLANPPHRAVMRHLPNLLVDKFPREVLMHIWDQLVLSNFRFSLPMWNVLSTLLEATWAADKIQDLKLLALGHALAPVVEIKKGGATGHVLHSELSFVKREAKKKPTQQPTSIRDREEYKYIYKLLERRFWHEIDKCSQLDTIDVCHDDESFLFYVPSHVDISDLQIPCSCLAESVVLFRPNLNTLQRMIQRVYPLHTTFCVNHPVTIPQTIYTALAAILHRRRGLAESELPYNPCTVHFELQGIQFRYMFVNVPTSVSHSSLVEEIFRSFGWLSTSKDSQKFTHCPVCNPPADGGSRSLDQINLCTCPVHYDWKHLEQKQVEDAITHVSAYLYSWLTNTKEQKVIKMKQREDVLHVHKDHDVRMRHASFHLSRALRMSLHHMVLGFQRGIENDKEPKSMK